MRIEARPYAAAFVDYAATKPDLVCLTGDLTASCEVDDFKAAYPERFYNIGMAEQNMIGIAGGMARGGLLPVVHTFGVFATRRPFDQLAMAIGFPRLRVRLMGFLPGLTTPGGVTHQAIDDVALMRSVPGMSVFDLGDASEIKGIHPLLDEIEGPAYCRVMRGEVPVLFHEPMVLGQARVLSRGSDLCLISSGAASAEAIAAAAAMSDAGLSVTHLHVSTLKPFDDPRIAEAMEACGGVLTVENHLTDGGLGTVVAETLAARRIGMPFAKLGLRDTYAMGGSQKFLFERFGLSTAHLIDAVEHLLGIDLAIEPATGPGSELRAQRERALSRLSRDPTL
jgi:transketolase